MHVSSVPNITRNIRLQPGRASNRSMLESTAAVCCEVSRGVGCAHSHLGEVVGSKGEELGGLGQVTSAQRTTGHLNHGAHLHTQPAT